MLNIFSCSCLPSDCIPWKNVYSYPPAHFLFGLFFGCLVACVFLYVLNINSLLNILFANIFSYSVGRLSVFLIVSLTVQKLFSLSHLLYNCKWEYIWSNPAFEAQHRYKIYVRYITTRNFKKCSSIQTNKRLNLGHENIKFFLQWPFMMFSQLLYLERAIW